MSSTTSRSSQRASSRERATATSSSTIRLPSARRCCRNSASSR
jgi:hypothetical protein